MKTLITLLLLSSILTVVAQNRPFDASYPDVHDPVMTQGEDGRYYIFSTGMGVNVMSSADLQLWQQEKPVFDAPQEWVEQQVPGYMGHWAPDISYHDGLWRLYYSCSTFGKNGSVIGLATNKTLDPTSPDYCWQDQGMVIASHRNQDDWNAIDPNLIVTPQNDRYLVFGSFWDGVQLIQLGSDFRTPTTQPKTIARRLDHNVKLDEIPFTVEAGRDTIEAGENAIEGPFIIYREGYYYLFVSFDYCCRGANSTYRTMYGRSRNVEGPYVDQSGKRMDMGGGTLLVGPTSRYYGRGHNGVYHASDDTWYFVCHAYDAEFGARSKLFLRTFTFDDQGWIVMNDEEPQVLTAPVTLSNIPTAKEVGPSVMPDTIAPITAPFDMPQLQRNVFPNRTVSITRMGARKGKFVRKQIQTAIDKLAAQGGGTVIIPAGDWYTGRIELKSNVCLQVDEGANVYFSGKVKDYLPVVFTRSAGIEAMSMGAMIYANGQHNIGITGKGKLIGPGRDCELWQKNPEYGSFDSRVNYDLDPTERIYDGHDTTCVYLPTFIGPINCSQVLIEGVDLSECVFWNIVPTYCDSVIIRGTRVHSVGLPMGDGMDIESSRNVLMEYNFLETGDDNFTIKAGRGIDGLRVNRPCENLVIRRNLTAIGHGGVTCGSETAGMIRNVYVCDNVFAGTNVGLRFKTRRPRGGGGENLYYERNRIRAVKEAITFDMLGSAEYVGGQAARVPMDVTRFTPVYRNVYIRDIIIEDASIFLKVTGIPESPARNINIERAKSKSRQLMSLHDMIGLKLTDAELTSEIPSIDISEAKEIEMKNVKLEVKK